ncbi:MAG: mannose-1-phosphate guanyltransferase [Denitrovibrio sp.]|nr:MAG: mannose-1-phosphate guanyltransferase [Denitrovibrio sp.]
MINLVLCGGAGKRLWPLSATDTPKQFIRFGMEESLYIKTIKRNQGLCDKTVVVTDQKYSETADQQVMDEKISAEIILEPSGKSTAPSIAIACLLYPNSIILATPADHEISDIEAYSEAVVKAKKLAEEGNIVVFGIQPEKPEDRFGYIEAKGDDVVTFHEKPELSIAENYIKNGYLVNSGMLCFNSDVMLHELLRFMPDQMMIARSVYENIRSGRATHRLCGRFMGQMKNISIDHAVLEKTDKLKCVSGIKGWRDVGTYCSIHDMRRKDKNGNVGLNLGDSFGCADFVGCKDSMIITKESDIILCGLDDVVVVEANGKVLVAKKDIDIQAALKQLED